MIEMVISLFILGLLFSLVIPIWKELSIQHHHIISTNEARILLQKEWGRFRKQQKELTLQFESQFIPNRVYMVEAVRHREAHKHKWWRIEIRWEEKGRWERLTLYQIMNEDLLTWRELSH